MNYKIDLDLWKKTVEFHAHKFHVDYGVENGPQFVVNLDHHFDDFYGMGPTNFALAIYDHDKKKWMSVEYPEDELSYQDFRDICNHNVGGHNGHITHYFDVYELNCIMMDILCELGVKK